MIHTIADMRWRIVGVQPEWVTRLFILGSLIVALFHALLDFFKFSRGDHQFKLLGREKSGWRVFIKI